jgi:chitinase
VFGGSFSFAASCTKRLLAYYAYWNSNYRSDKIQYSKLTHICHAFAEPNADGTLYLDPGPPALLEPALITNAHAAGVKVLISIGGASAPGQPPDSTFRAISQSAPLRTAFAANIAAFCATYGYDGVDIDWEMPGAMDPTNPGATDMANFDLLIQAIRTAFNSKNSAWLISIATSPDNWGAQWLDYPVLNNYVDFYNDMTYDMHGSWNGTMGYNAPLYQGNYSEDNLCDQTCMDYVLTTRAVPAEKVNMGIPFYGQYFPGSNVLFYKCGNCSTTQANYSAIAPLIGNGWTYNWDAASQVPYLTNVSGAGIYSYDDAQSVGLKADYALNARNAGGIFMWDLSEDYMGAGNEPLLDAMYAKFSAFCPGNSPTFTPTLTHTSTLNPTLTLSQTPSLTNSPTYSATKTATVISTATLTFTATLTHTDSATVTSTPPAATSTATATGTNTATVANAMTRTETAMPTCSPTTTTTVQNTATRADTATASPGESFTYTPGTTASETATRTWTNTTENTFTFTATPSNTVQFASTVTFTPTAANAFTVTSTTTTPVNTPTPTATTLEGKLEILDPVAYPNPYNDIDNTGMNIRFKLSGTAIRIKFRFFTRGFRLIREALFTAGQESAAAGISVIAVPPNYFSGLAAGTYYYVLTAEDDSGNKTSPVIKTIIIIR